MQKVEGSSPFSRFAPSTTRSPRRRALLPAGQLDSGQTFGAGIDHRPRMISAIVQPAAQIRVGDQPETTAVIAQVRPATSTTPKQTMITHRYLYWKNDRLLILSCSSPKGTDNSAAYELIGTTVEWK